MWRLPNSPLYIHTNRCTVLWVFSRFASSEQQGSYRLHTFIVSYQRRSPNIWHTFFKPSQWFLFRVCLRSDIGQPANFTQAKYFISCSTQLPSLKDGLWRTYCCSVQQETTVFKLKHISGDCPTPWYKALCQSLVIITQQHTAVFKLKPGDWPTPCYGLAIFYQMIISKYVQR